MYTVVRWRNTPDGYRYVRENPCAVLLGNAICYIISGTILLVVGVIITSVTFQNLEEHDDEHTERYAGPILIVVGVLVIARGAFNHYRPIGAPRTQAVIRSYTGDLFTRPIIEYSSNSMTMCSVSIADTHEYPRRSLYMDEPPPYDIVVATSRFQNNIRETRDESTQSPDVNSDPPPTYEEFLRNIEDTTSDSTCLPDTTETKEYPTPPNQRSRRHR